jgi:hypothetical protein
MPSPVKVNSSTVRIDQVLLDEETQETPCFIYDGNTQLNVEGSGDGGHAGGILPRFSHHASCARCLVIGEASGHHQTLFALHQCILYRPEGVHC